MDKQNRSTIGTSPVYLARVSVLGQCKLFYTELRHTAYCNSPRLEIGARLLPKKSSRSPLEKGCPTKLIVILRHRQCDKSLPLKYIYPSFLHPVSKEGIHIPDSSLQTCSWSHIFIVSEKKNYGNAHLCATLNKSWGDRKGIDDSPTLRSM